MLLLVDIVLSLQDGLDLLKVFNEGITPILTVFSVTSVLRCGYVAGFIFI